MIRIYHLHCKRELYPGELRSALDLLDENHHDKLLKYRRWQDREAGLFGRLLLLAGLIDSGFEKLVLPPFSANDFGKPGPLGGMHFNISHSGEHVICAMSAAHFLGIDTEFMESKLELEDFKNFFRPDEWKQIGGNHQLFYTLWTQKEAVLKAAGTGFSKPAKDVIIDKQRAFLSGNTYRLQRIGIVPAHETHLATPDETPGSFPVVREWGYDIITYLKGLR